MKFSGQDMNNDYDEDDENQTTRKSKKIPKISTKQRRKTLLNKTAKEHIKVELEETELNRKQYYQMVFDIPNDVLYQVTCDEVVPKLFVT